MQITKELQLNFKNRTDIIVISIIVFSVIIGLIIRLKGLGVWALALDEYYTVESAKNILKYGVPMWDSGGYYMRGILIKYITALFLWSGFDAEYGSRLVTVIANILTIPALLIPSLMKVIEESGHRVWFIARNKVYFDEMPFYDHLQDYLFYTGRDESTWVFLFTPSDQQ